VRIEDGEDRRGALVLARGIGRARGRVWACELICHQDLAARPDRDVPEIATDGAGDGSRRAERADVGGAAAGDRRAGHESPATGGCIRIGQPDASRTCRDRGLIEIRTGDGVQQGEVGPAVRTQGYAHASWSVGLKEREEEVSVRVE